MDDARGCRCSSCPRAPGSTPTCRTSTRCESGWWNLWEVWLRARVGRLGRLEQPEWRPICTRRVLHACSVLVGITLVAFLLIHLVPGDPVRIMLGAHAPPAAVRGVRHQLGPRPARCRRSTSSFLGQRCRAATSATRSTCSSRSRRASARGSARASSCSATATLISPARRVPLGIVSALLAEPAARPRDPARHHSSAFAMPLVLARAAPGPEVFSLHLGWFPVSGLRQRLRRPPARASRCRR